MHIPLKFEKTLVNLAPWAEQDQLSLRATSVLTPDFLELSRHPLLGWPDSDKTRRTVGPVDARPGC
jgi:hypothetical protein